MRRIVFPAAALAIAASVFVRIGGQVATREAAYRSNNIGVAYLEQYNFEAAAASFRTALEQDGTLALARLNLGIALFYAGQPDAAVPELERARQALPDRPHADYVLGLIARAANRPEDALAAFTRARKIDATDPGIAINIGQLHLQQRQYKEALASFRVAEAAEPYNATAAYGLATALIRSGAGDEGKGAMAHFEKLRESSYATTFSPAYLEQGRYAEAIASTGAEAGLVDERTPETEFANATAGVFSTPPAGGAVTLFDVDADGDLDLAVAGDSPRLYRNDRGRMTDATAAAFGASPPPAANGIVAGDADNDGDNDLLVLGAAGPPLLYRQQPALTFAAAGADAGMPAMQGARTAAWLDADHDGDLDAVLAGVDAGKRPATFLLRNNGEGKFADISAAAGLAPSAPADARIAVAVVPTDFDNRRDIDILAATAIGGVHMFRNMRDGTFRDVAQEIGLAQTGGGGVSAVAVADVNKDGYPDAFFGNPSGIGGLAMSDGRARFAVTTAPQAAANARAAQFLDYDNDGVIDLLVLTPQGPRLLRNLGGRWIDVSDRAFKGAAPAVDAFSLASGDLDGDGDTDVVIAGKSGTAVLRNDGGSRSRSLAIRLQPRVTNRSAVGAKIELRAGSLRQRLETSAAWPAPVPADIVFGVGTRSGADVARVLWPSGILQAETATGSPEKPGDGLSGMLKVEELDRKPSSCPYLFTWNGTRFEFITDFLGGGEMGYWLAPGVRNVPDPDEYVRIDGRLLQPRGGRYELRVTNELEETVFLDRAELVAIAHPSNVEVHPNEGLKSTPAPFTLYAVRDTRPPAAAHDDRGRDVLDRVAATDRRYVDGFPLERVRGYAAEHSLTLTLPPSSSDRRVLLLTGWTDYAFSGDNVAAHQLGLRMLPPSLQIEAADGTWRTAVDEIGFPVGRPQTVAVDLTGKVPASAKRVRVVTTMRIYWDRVQVGTLDDRSQVQTMRPEALSSELRWRGFSVENPPDGREPLVFDYGQVRPFSPWKVMTGRYTREGDVRELLTRTDDRFVIGRPGDEIALSFDATRLPPLPPGWTRTFLLHADGFSKEMNLSSASPDEVEPLPFHGMTHYPYAPADAPAVHASPAHQAYVSRYNTRVVKRNIPPLELSGR